MDLDRELVEDLREAGKATSGEVYRRLRDAPWREDQDLAEGLTAMARGEKIPAAGREHTQGKAL